MTFVLLQSYDNYVSAHIAMGRLEEDGVNCWLKDENTVTINPILTNAIGGIKLMVESTQADRAATILKDLELQYKENITCPQCGSHNIELVSTPRKPSNWIMALFGYLAGGYALSAEKVNHCFDCGKEFPAESDS
jgi:DNA-directed RNA polymerase subunit RPC12/RpoP